MPAAVNPMNRVGRPPKPPLLPKLWTENFYPQPMKEPAALLLGSKQGDLLLVFAKTC